MLDLEGKIVHNISSYDLQRNLKKDRGDNVREKKCNVTSLRMSTCVCVNKNTAVLFFLKVKDYNRRKKQRFVRSKKYGTTDQRSIKLSVMPYLAFFTFVHLSRPTRGKKTFFSKKKCSHVCTCILCTVWSGTQLL
jgi:hypothetical protein